MVCLLHEKARKGTTKNAHGQIFLEKNVFFDKKVRFVKIAVSFTSLIPSLILPTDDRETTDRTTVHPLAYKKCCLLRFPHTLPYLWLCSRGYPRAFSKLKMAIFSPFSVWTTAQSTYYLEIRGGGCF